MTTGGPQIKKTLTAVGFALSLISQPVSSQTLKKEPTIISREDYKEKAMATNIQEELRYLFKDLKDNILKLKDAAAEANGKETLELRVVVGNLRALTRLLAESKEYGDNRVTSFEAYLHSSAKDEKERRYLQDIWVDLFKYYNKYERSN